MTADAFRRHFEHHFLENRHIWDDYIMQLLPEQFAQKTQYAAGSVRDQVVHLMSVDDIWFSALCDNDLPYSLDPQHFDSRESVRAHWDNVEMTMRVYLDDLQDSMLLQKPWSEGEDKDLYVWQVLLHVMSHGADHRAQLLVLLNDLGIQTDHQDHDRFAYDNA